MFPPDNVNIPEAFMLIVNVLPVVVVTSAGVVSSKQTQSNGLIIVFTVALRYITANLATIEPPEAVHTGLPEVNVITPAAFVQDIPDNAKPPVR